jgi:hypothetical protein
MFHSNSEEMENISKWSSTIPSSYFLHAWLSVYVYIYIYIYIYTHTHTYVHTNPTHFTLSYENNHQVKTTQDFPLEYMPLNPMNMFSCLPTVFLLYRVIKKEV